MHILCDKNLWFFLCKISVMLTQTDMQVYSGIELPILWINKSLLLVRVDQKLPLLLIIILHHDSELRFKLIYRYLSTSKYISYIFFLPVLSMTVNKTACFCFSKKKKKAFSLPNPFLNRLDKETMTSL